MKGVKDLHKEMLNVQMQLSLLKGKVRKTSADTKEIFILTRYFECLELEYILEPK